MQAAVRRLSEIALILCALVPVARAETTTPTPPSVTLNPGYTSIGVNQTLQYTAIVVGLVDKSVTWMVAGVPGGNSTYGKISNTGLYTAPAVIPSGGITVSALAADHKTIATVYVNVAPAGPSISSIAPNPIPTGNFSITLTGTGFQQNAYVLMNGNNRLSSTWVNSTTLKVSAWYGTVGPATFAVSNPGTLYGPVFNASFVQSGPPPPQTISPTNISIQTGSTQQFTSANATSWTASAGTITQTGLYTAPALLPATNPVTVTATGSGGSESAKVTVVDPNAPVISPVSVTLNLSSSQQFVSAGATSWTAVAGTVDSTGLYTAPTIYPASGKDTVTATGPNGSAAATVTFNLPTPAITGIGVNGLPLGVFNITITGTGFTAKSTAMLGSSPLNISSVAANGGSLNASGFASVSGPVNLVVSNPSLPSAPFPVQVGVANALVSASAARRFLEQAAFGPTPADAAHVQAIGFQAWINEQLAMPQASNYSAVLGSQGGLGSTFLANAVTNPDQLRQRVAFALSQIFVVSINKLIWNEDVIPYEQMLLADAFTNYRKILGDVTLSPGMGRYLDMANNAKANPAAGTAANENYAREVMQLFSMGDILLNPDGTAPLDPVTNLPMPAYLQPNVSELARVFTGWTYTPVNPGSQPVWGAYINSAGPMVPYPAMHDFGSKTLLNGYVAAPNLTPQADLQAALDNIASHANVAPFISRQLIQHLVKSNPTPAYVQRVAQAFLDSNGDMPTIVSTILLDIEARANDTGGSDQPSDGHLQEPAVFIPAFVRAFNGQMTPANYYASDLASLGQDIYNPASVFNYFSPGYTVAGTGGLKGPEFQIDNPNAAILRENLVAQFFSQYSNPVASNGPGTTVDLTPFLPLAVTPATLLDAIDLTLTHGTMPPAMKQTILTAVTADTAGSLHRVQTACYLVLTSSYYNVWH